MVGRRETGVPLPTEAELEILQLLWEAGPSTVREVHEALRRRRDVGYTTALKLLQIMLEKGLVTRDESARSHVYEAAVGRESAQRRLVADLAEKAFGGSAVRLAMQALDGRTADETERAEIRALLEQLERRAEGGRG